jgi:hypothetical protein
MRSLAPIFLLAFGHVNAQWFQMPDFPGTPRDDASAFTIGAAVFVGTGMEEGMGLTNDWYRFDGSTDQWSVIAPLPATPRHFCSAFVFNYPEDAYGYLFGGLDINGPLNELWRYDPATDSWTQMASFPGEPRYSAVAFNGGFIATGLFTDGSATSELWQYVPATDTWHQRASIPGAPRQGACGGNWFGTMVIGGADADLNALTDCWSYNALTDTWSACASLPQGRYGANCGFASYNFIIIGGAIDATTIVETALSFNVTAWLPLGDPHPGGTRRGGIMIEAGGGGAGGTRTYIGLGISNELERKNDWYMSSAAFGVTDRSTGTLAVHPNPASNQVWPQLPKHWPFAKCIVRDALGRTVVDQRLLPGSNLHVGELTSGRYEMLVQHGGERLRAPLIKLP